VLLFSLYMLVACNQATALPSTPTSQPTPSLELPELDFYPDHVAIAYHASSFPHADPSPTEPVVVTPRPTSPLSESLVKPTATSLPGIATPTPPAEMRGVWVSAESISSPEQMMKCWIGRLLAGLTPIC